MTRCANPTIKDLLPDLLHDRLSAALRADVQAHLAACAECRLELRILRQVVAVSATPRIDAARIAAAVPRYRAPSAWQRATHSTQLRIAAAIVLLAGGAAVLAKVVNRDAGSTRIAIQTPVRTDSSVGVPPSTTPSTVGATAAATKQAKGPSHATTELALGETLHDLSDAQLRALLGELGTLEAVTPTETEVVVPALGRGSQ